MNRYHYLPLPPTAPTGVTPPFTRLLLLAPGRQQETLACALTTVDIQHAPRFEALSYSWGRESASQPIWCDGQPIWIKLNLDYALRNLRLPYQARRLWVDALCIDQANVDERTRQVRYMRLIYKHAARTIVWLGLRTHGIEEVFRLSQTIADIKSVHSPTLDHEHELITELFDANPDIVDQLIAFFDREYFMCIWCV